MDQSFNPAVPYLSEARPRKFPWVNVVLFLATCLSTLLTGSFMMMGFKGAVTEDLFHPSSLLMGLPFCVTIMSILFAHEMGHYLLCRYYGIDASLPYFIPLPILSLVGTMGAFIRIRGPIRDRGSLLEVGVGGPIAGFVVAVIALVVSIGHSRFVVLQPSSDTILLGEPLIFKAVQYLTGMTPPAGMDVYLHPVSMAAWFGFLVTALNLLPAAQLDGGHIAYALFRRHHRWISLGVVLALIPLAIFYFTGWWLWIVLLLVLRLYHPPTLDDSVPLRPRHIVLGLIGLVLLVLCLMPAPISI
jgi:membrane-associated protease RseP (regulator of RpoE activity)